MLLKITTTDERTFDLVSDVRRVSFRERDGAEAVVTFADGTEEVLPVPTSAFVLNEAGVTIERFHAAKQKEKQT